MSLRTLDPSAALKPRGMNHTHLGGGGGCYLKGSNSQLGLPLRNTLDRLALTTELFSQFLETGNWRPGC